MNFEWLTIVRRTIHGVYWTASDVTPEGPRPAPAHVVDLLEDRALLSVYPLEFPGDPAFRSNAGFTTNQLVRGDDAVSSPKVNTGFVMDFFGTTFDGLYVNNNGDVTFTGPYTGFSPDSLNINGTVIMAPFFADVDTRNPLSGTVTYGTSVVDGQAAFGVNWKNVGYFSSNADKLNDFQLVIVDRSDIRVGDFDFEFNYTKIQWETGEANSGTNGLGGNSALAGYSNGAGVTYTFAGSQVNGAFLDSGPVATRLIGNSLNSVVDGRYRFSVRSGVVQAEIDVTDLATRTGVPDETGQVDFGPVLTGNTATRTLRVRNAGNQSLTVQPATVTGPFTIVTNLGVDQVIPAGGFFDVVVRFNGGAVGNYSGTFSFANTDADESPYNFELLGRVVNTADPEIQVILGATNILDDQSTVSFGTTVSGSPVSRTFRVYNQGISNLVVQPLTVPAGFTVTTNFTANQAIASGAFADVVVRLDAVTPGSYLGQLSFGNNDSDENPFNFDISGIVLFPTQEIAVFDGTTNIPDNSGLFDFGSTVQGTPLTRNFTVVNQGNQNLVLQPITATGDFSILSNFTAGQVLLPGAQTQFTVQFNASIIGVQNGTLSFGNNDTDENPFNFNLRGTATVPPAPEIEVRLNSTDIPDNTGSVNFGSTVRGTPISRTFTVVNSGTAGLIVSPISAPLGFSITSDFTANQVIPVGGQATFTVRLNAALSGTFTGQISFINSDGDENPFNFTVTGTVIDPGEIVVRDGVQTLVDGVSNVSFGAVVQGSPAITKTFTIVNIGAAPLVLQPATFITGFGFSFTSNFTTNQVVPVGLTTTISITMDTSTAGTKQATLYFENTDDDENPFTLELSGSVFSTNVKEVEVKLGSDNIPNGFDAVDMGNLVVGNVASRTFVVRNLGTGTLNLSPATVGAGFSITQNLPSSLAAGQSANLIVSINTATSGTRNAVLSFVNDDADESPFSFRLKGAVFATQAAEVEVRENGVDLSNNALFTYGPSYVGQLQSRTFVVKNIGATTLNLQPATVGMNLGLAFSILQQLPATLAPGASANLTVVMETGSVGPRSAVLSFVNDDSNENPFTLRLTSEVFATQAAEVELRHNGIELSDGFNAFTYGNSFVGDPQSRTFVVKNIGATSLNLSPATVGAGFTIAQNLPLTLAPGATANLTVSMDTATVGPRSANLSFANSDSNESPYDVRLVGAVFATQAQEVEVRENGVDLPNGLNAFTYGPSYLGQPQSRTFVVRNIGATALNLTPATVGAGYTITQNLPASLAPGARANLTVVMDTTSIGIKTAVLSIGSNDGDENPFTLNLKSEVFATQAAEVELRHNGIELSDGFNAFTYGNSFVGGTSSRTFVVRNIGATSLNLLPATVGAGFTITQNLPATLLPGATANLTVSMDTTAVGTRNANLSFKNSDSNESPYDVRLVGEVFATQAAEVEVRHNNVIIPDEFLHFTYGTAFVGQVQSRTFVVQNLGATTLTLSPVIFTAGSGFTITQNLPPSLAPGAKANFTVSMNTSTPGSRATTVSFANSDPNEGPYNFVLTGNVASPVVVDNSDASYSETGNWTTTTGGRNNSYRLTNDTTGNSTASWLFSGLISGTYRISASWVNVAGRATNATYTFRNGAGGAVLGTGIGNQTQLANDRFENGIGFKDVGTAVVTNGSLQVQLSSLGANGLLSADAIRIERIA